MFFQVRIPEHQRRFFRFLWWPEGKHDGKFKRFQMKVLVFGAISSPSCANFAFRKVGNDFGTMYLAEVNKCIRNNFYVDDCLKSCKTQDGMIQLAKDLKDLCAQWGFTLKKWASNCRKLLVKFPEEDLAKSLKGIDVKDSPLPQEKALGIVWDTQNDCLRIHTVDTDKPLTRRGVMSVSSIFDPIGMASPFVLRGRAILRNLCKMKINWDDTIPEEVNIAWREWKSKLPSLSGVSIKRCYSYGMNENSKYELHNFSDASELGYACASYLRVIDASGVV